MTGTRKTTSGGFSLIELLVVVAIIGLLGSVALPAASSHDEHNLDLVEIQIRDAFRRATALARSTRSAHGVVFDTQGERFAVVDGDGQAVTDPLTRKGYVVGFERPDQPAQINIATASFGGTPAAIFDGHGVALEGGRLVLICRRSRRILELDKATGQITVP